MSLIKEKRKRRNEICLVLEVPEAVAVPAAAITVEWADMAADLEVTDPLHLPIWAADTTVRIGVAAAAAVP